MTKFEIKYGVTHGIDAVGLIDIGINFDISNAAPEETAHVNTIGNK